MNRVMQFSPHCNYVPIPKRQKSKGQTRISCPSLLVTGLDKLEISLHLSILNYSIFDSLSFQKNQVQSSLSSSIPFSFGSKEFFKWNLQRVGTKLYPYVLRSGDLTLLLSSRPGDSTIPNCKIEIGSISSQTDPFNIYHKIIMWLNCYGFSLEKEIISRVDLAVDCIGISIKGLGVSLPNRWITRARKYSIYYEDWKLTGIMIGKGNIALRIYDKSFELKKNKVKAQFFHEKWGIFGRKDSFKIPVTRVEFQFRRALLKEFSIPINTINDLQKNLDSIWQYSCIKWARLCRCPVDRKNNNHKQAVLSSFWRKIQGVIFSFPSASNKRIKKNLTKNLIALRAQARGCLMNIAAASGHDPDDFFGIIATVQDVISTDFADFMTDRYSDFVKLFNQRLNECYIGF